MKKMDIKVIDTKDKKIIKGDNFNHIFDKITGQAMTWGRTYEDDPDFGPPLILDMEVTTKCSGVRDECGKRSPCKFCYKSNTSKGHNMSLETFKKIIDRLPSSIGQIALGADASCLSNPDIFEMMAYARAKDIVPNITVADIDDKVADELSVYCGAVAVSFYPQRDKNRCYDSVKKLVDRGMTQVNIHCMIAEESFESTLVLFDDCKTDERLNGLNAVVLLSLKQRGRGKGFTPLAKSKFTDIVNKGFELGVAIGFDSCSAPKFLNAVKDRPDYKKFEMMSEPCESGLFSTYINEKGCFYPCSFAEGIVSNGNDWRLGLDVANCEDFMKDIWFHPKVVDWRENLIKNKDCRGCRMCPLFEV